MNSPSPVPPHVLVVDDDRELCQVLTNLLTDEGFTVTVCNNGVEAVAAHHARPASLVIMDIMMPQKEGVETIGELKRDWPDCRIIAMTGSRDPSILKMASYFGADRCVLKPFENSQLIATMRELLAEGSTR